MWARFVAFVYAIVVIQVIVIETRGIVSFLYKILLIILWPRWQQNFSFATFVFFFFYIM